MRNKAIILCIFFVHFYPVLAQDIFYFDTHSDLRPEINVFTGNAFNTNTRRALLFRPPSYSSSKQVILCEMPNAIVYSLLPQQMGMNKERMYGYIWDPHIKKNYMYCSDDTRDEEAGWYSFIFSNSFLAFHLHKKLRDWHLRWANNSPPYIQLSDTRVFTAQYLYDSLDINTRAPITMFKSFFKIIDINLIETVWEYNTASDSFSDIYWITGQWFFIQRRNYFLIFGESSKENTIYNYETDETVSFSPEIIIGYGAGVIITTTETENGFIGITVWTPDKEILYRDSGLLLAQPYNGQRPVVYVSYFDYPYIYCNIGVERGFVWPFRTLIMDLIAGKTYYTPLDYHLYGIFEMGL